MNNMTERSKVLRKKIGKLKKELYRIRAVKHKKALREEEKHKRKLLIQERKRKHRERVYERLRKYEERVYKQLRKQQGYLFKQLHIIFLAARTHVFEGEIIKELPVWSVLLRAEHVITWGDIDNAFLKAQNEEGQTGWSYLDHKIDKVHYKRIKGGTLEEWL